MLMRLDTGAFHEDVCEIAALGEFTECLFPDAVLLPSS